MRLRLSVMADYRRELINRIRAARAARPLSRAKASIRITEVRDYGVLVGSLKRTQANSVLGSGTRPRALGMAVGARLSSGLLSVGA